MKAIARSAVRKLPEGTRVRLRRYVGSAKRHAGEARRHPLMGKAEQAVRLVTRPPRAEDGSALLSATSLQLDATTTWFRFEVEPYQRYLLRVRTADPIDPELRAGLVRYRFLDRFGRVQRNPAVTKPDSPTYGYFDYLPRTPVDRWSSYVVFSPEGCRSVDVGLRSYKAGGTEPVIEAASFEHLGHRSAPVRYDLPETGAPRIPVRLAVIADTFTLDALSRECQILPLSRSNWRDELVEFAPDLLLVESAWNGNDGDWQYAIFGYTPGKNELGELAGVARELGIPSLFWNKEDPPHFEDFLGAARLFDHVGTTDGSLIEDYRRELGHDRVFALPFAVQTDLHNPRRPGDQRVARADGPVFLGSWWAHKFDERREAQEALLQGSLAHDLEIYDRYLTFNDHERYRFPARWLPYVHGTLSYDRALTAYRSYRVVLNVNTVTDSPTMFSRRALEASACGALVVSNPSVGTREALGDLVIEADTADRCRDELKALYADPDSLDVLAHRAYRHTHLHHSWRNRFCDLTPRLGLVSLPPIDRSVSVVLASKRPDGASRLLRWMTEVEGAELEPILVVDYDPDELDGELVRRAGARVIRQAADQTLGDCLNVGVDLATAAYVAKVDDDDHYGRNYFLDLLLAAEYSRADITGKQSHLQYFEVVDRTVLRYPGSEHRFTDFVSGSTFLIRRSVFDHVRFPSRRVSEDTRFLERARDAGLSIYAADRFNYVSMRRTDLEEHTWAAAHDELLEGNETAPVADGFATQLLDV